MVTAEDTFFTKYHSPIGELLIVGTDTAITQISFPTHPGKKTIRDHRVKNRQPFTEVCRQLDLYFAQRLTRFELNLQPAGTKFQQAVWAHLQQIPYGQTASYTDIAIATGNPKATRAVGSANGSNPIPIIIPCHRVIGRDGSLTGFGGGLPIKQFLLQLEDSEQMSLAL